MALAGGVPPLESPFFDASVFRRLTPPLDVNEEGRRRFGCCFGAGTDLGLTPLVDRERRELGVPSLSGSIRTSSLSFQDSLGVCIGVSGTGMSVSAAGA